MRPEFTVAWALWLAGAVLAEIVGVGRPEWAAILGTLCVIEALAILRRGPGDTGSEHVWWWVERHDPDPNPDDEAPLPVTTYPGRAAMGAALGLWISYRAYSITPGGVGPALLCSALAAWLVPHFATGGRTG